LAGNQPAAGVQQGEALPEEDGVDPAGAGGEGGEVATTNQPDWETIEADLETEVGNSAGADADPGAPAAECGAGPGAALGVLVATSDTNEFVGNANVELTQDTGEAPAEGAGGAPGEDTTAAPEGAPDGGGEAEAAPQRRPADKTKPTNANNGSAIWNPFEPAGDYFINIPVLPEDYQDKYRPTPEDEYTVTVAEGGTATKIVFIHPKPWIEIELLDSTGEPARGHAYRLELPLPEDAEEGAEPVVLKEGSLDDDGFARVTEDDVPPDTDLAACNVIFPATGAAEIAEAVLDAADWIRIELRDTLGQPAKNWRYEVYAQGNEDGEPDYTGTLDAVGTAMVMGDAQLDQCEIAFLPPLEGDGIPEAPQTGNWVKIEALDGRGEPAARWRYEIAIVGRASRYSGTLDTTGQALVPIFVGEECEITFSPPLG